MDRHVDAIATGVFDHQELGVLVGHLHGRESHVATDTVLFMHHRRAGHERGEIAQDRGGIELAVASTSFLLRAMAEQLAIRQQQQWRFGTGEAADIGSDGERYPRR